MQRRITANHLVMMEGADITRADVEACGTVDGDAIVVDTASECWRAIDGRWRTRDQRREEEAKARVERQAKFEAEEAERQRQQEWTPKQPSRGLGDVVAKLTAATGLDKVAERVAGAVGAKDCGCKRRQAMLNKLVPFKQDDPASPSPQTPASPLDADATAT